MNILAIDTSCDETSVAVTANTEIVSSVIWSQVLLHSSFGGVMPSLAQREHEKKIDYVLEKAIKKAKITPSKLDAVAVTIGPGLGIALGVGINKAIDIARKYKLPLIPINHIEAHLLSPFVNTKLDINYPSLGLVLSGGTTLLARVNKIGDYQILAETADDALGEALDKAARLLGFGYPGASFLEIIARGGDSEKYKLPIPLVGDKNKNRFSYSGLKTAFVRLFSNIKDPNKEDLADLAAAFQKASFKHVCNVLEYQIKKQPQVHDLLFGGGVANNIEVRKQLRKICSKHKIKLHIPISKKLMGDNAAMVGVCAFLKYKSHNLKKFFNYKSVDRNPKLTFA